MRLLHTSDWHLGHRLHRRTRSEEHRHFLEWLLGLLRDMRVDALLIAGDIFDTANPPAPALELWYSFLARCATQIPGLQIVVVGGNHDSAARLDAPEGLLRALDIRVVGGARKNGELRAPKDMVLRLKGRSKEEPSVWIAAVPFLRPVDLPPCGDDQAMDPLIEGVRQYYQAVFDALRQDARPGDRFVAMGHLYLREGQLSELSERKILGGNQHALPADIFPAWLDYVALGHLHRAQAVARDCIRYCGSPIPLAMDERHYRHEVSLVTLEASKTGIESIRIPRYLPLLRIPDKGSQSLEEALGEINARLPELKGTPEASKDSAFVEVSVRLSEPDPDLRSKIEGALEAHGQLLSSLVVEYAGQQTSLGETVVQKELNQLSPQEVLCAMHLASFGENPEPALLEAFAELVQDLDQEEARG